MSINWNLIEEKIREITTNKVEKISEDSLDSISSPSVKIQIPGGKVYLR